jgi:hypothetical protein
MGNEVPSTIKTWRDANGDVYAVMAKVLVKKDGTKEDVENALAEAHKGVMGNIRKKKTYLIPTYSFLTPSVTADAVSP